MSHDIVSRFIEYCKINTQSDDTNFITTPSTKCQLDLAKVLVQELHEMGLDNAYLDAHGYVYARLEATKGYEDLPCVGLIAHMDTATELTGKDVKPQILKYTGENLVLNKEKNIVLACDEFDFFDQWMNEDFICTDGTTLLGADDKAGIAEIMQAVQEIIEQDIPHGAIAIAFTPDEEIGQGPSQFDVKGFNANFAFTVDGGDIHDYEYETFNAVSAKVTIHGFSIHPGSSKDKMRNASLIAMEYNSLLPSLEIPRHTDGYEGFYHLCDINGGVDEAHLNYILRDHDGKRMEARKKMMLDAAEQINLKWGENTVEVILHEQYKNMVEILKDKMEIVELARKAMVKAGIDHPTHNPIRGGTDGCQLTFKGLPCPNLPTGGYNAHGRFECIPVKALTIAKDIIKNIVDVNLLKEM